MADLEPNWRLAACAGQPTYLWFPEPNHQADYAKLICSGCVIRDDCLEYALRHQIRFGVWGGLGELARRRLRRSRRERTECVA